jgi:hypothetical protein
LGFYRKKPIVVEAHRFDGSATSAAFIIKWSNLVVTGPYDEDSKPYLLIETEEGVMKAEEGDWVIRGVAHEFYPCKPDIFGVTYESVANG